MAEWFTQQAAAGSMIVAAPVALVAGLVSFFSPCVLPLVPGYLAYATGLTGADLADAEVARSRRGRLFLGSVLFVLGFTVVFVLLGAFSGGIGSWLVEYRRELNVVLGIVSILMGLVFLGLGGVLQREWRVHAVPRVGLAAAPVLGFLFGVGWIPCVSPTLGVILTLSINEGTVPRGIALSIFYALGLGLPFILAGLAYERMLGAIRFVRRHQLWVMRFGGALMITVGLLLLTGLWDRGIDWLQIQLVEFNEVAV